MGADAVGAALAPPSGGPTIEDARAAASIAAEDPRVEQVLVFGSVARGDASRLSDIDILVLLSSVSDDEWRKAWSDIAAAVQIGTRWPVDVIVQPRADFEHLSHNVTASFEHGAAAEAEVLYQSSPVLPPAGGTLDSVPRDNLALAADQARSANRYLRSLLGVIDSIPASETRAGTASASVEFPVASVRRTRYLDVLEAAHMVIEQSFRASASASEGLSLGGGHEIDKFIGSMGETPERAALEAAVSSIRGHGDRLRNWRLASYTGHLPEWSVEATSDNASAHVSAALACARTAAAAIESRAGSDDYLLNPVREMLGTVRLLEQSPHSPSELEAGPAAGA